MLVAFCTGESVKTPLVKSFGKHLPPKTELMVAFGLAETGPILCKRIVNPTHADFPSSIVPIGRPLPGIICLLLDDNQRLITHCDQTGELYVGGKLTSHIP